MHIQAYENNLLEMIGKLTNQPNQSSNKEEIKAIERKLFYIVKDHFFDKLTPDFLNKVNIDFICRFSDSGCSYGRIRYIWELFTKVNPYINANSDNQSPPPSEKDISNMVELLVQREKCGENCFINSNWTKEDLAEIIKSKLNDLIKFHFFDKFSPFFFNNVEDILKKYFFSSEMPYNTWNLFRKINEYINNNNIKTNLIDEIEILIKSKSIIDRSITKAIYLSNIPELIALHQKYFPKPHISIFDPDNIPQCFIQENENNKETKRVVTEFKQRNIRKKSVISSTSYSRKN
jgi:hypothetical protein